MKYCFQAEQLYFRGQRIWSAAMEHLMAEGMQNATQVSYLLCHLLNVMYRSYLQPLYAIYVFQALLSGCSAGGLASIIHCDEFRDLFPQSTNVKCLSDAGLFLDA